MAVLNEMQVQHDAPIPTWFGVGGRADRLARVGTLDDVRWCLEMDPELRVLGEGANLLVCDEGVGELVMVMDRGELKETRVDAGTGRVWAGAGADLPRLILDCVRAGLGGIEGLGGIPATVGGALVMNAGGAWGEIGTAVESVRVMDRTGVERVLGRKECGFGYRRSELARNGWIVLGAELRLEPRGGEELRGRLKDVMAKKKGSQPMAERSAGCVFRNPTLGRDVDGIGAAGERVSAGLLIDRAGCKGLRVGGARVSERHANFIVAEPGRGNGAHGATASDVIRLMDEVKGRVEERFGVELEREVVVWRRA